MQRYAALIRGINVGGRQKLAMADLRALMAALGHTDVRTYLQSGNAVFAGPAADELELGQEIEEAIRLAAGLSVRCLVRGREEVHAVINANPLASLGDDGAKMFAFFLSAPPAPELLAAHDPRELDPGNVAVGGRVIYQWCPHGFMEAPQVGVFAERNLGVTATARNWNTVTMLGTLLDS